MQRDCTVAIHRDEVLKIAALAKLRFSERELEEFIPRFQGILDYVDKLKEVEIGNVEPTSQVSGTGGSRLRADEVRPSLGVEEALENAPEEDAVYFRVPRVI